MGEEVKGMAKQYAQINDELSAFISQQKIFFVATAVADGNVNISPKGMDSFRIVDANRIIWLNLTGSGNETAAHLQTHPRMTIMFNAFEGAAMILRLYGEAKAVHKKDEAWDELYAMFDDIAGARQIFDMRVDLVQTSCGMAVPYFDYVKPRDELRVWAEKKGELGMKEYWLQKNQVSLDGIETGIVEKNG